MAVAALMFVLLNPYLVEFSALPPTDRRDVQDALIYSEQVVYRSESHRASRDDLTHRYSWAVPTEEAISAIASRCDRVLDFGAGSGYWSWLLSQAGVEVRAVDDWSWGRPAHLWFPVETGSHGWLRQFDSSWCLMLVWPPDGPMATEALRAWRGDTLIYVGEWQRGSATAGFFSSLVINFDHTETVAIPQWWNRSDWLYIFWGARR